MLKKFILLFTLFISQFGLGQDFQWVGQIKGVEMDFTETADFIEVDNNGNSYTLGKAYSTQYDINPTLSGVQIINNQNSLVQYPEDIYLTKLNDNGNFVWGKSLSVLKDYDSALGLKFDSQGNIYVLAFITELYQNQTIVYGYGFLNIIKIDPNGNEIYRRKFQNLGNINSGKLLAISSFDIDSSDNIYVTGIFNNTVILDSNPQNNLVTNGSSSYVFKLDQNGNIIWTKNLDYLSPGVTTINIDSNDQVNLLFNSYNPNINYYQLNILKLNNSNGNQIWLKTCENLRFGKVELDSNNNFVFTGLISDNIIFDLNPDPNVSNLVQNTNFILFLDSNGNYIDSKLFDLNITFSAIHIDNLNNYQFGGGYVNSNIDFDPSLNNYYLTATSQGNVGYGSNGFFLKLNSNRDFAQAFSIGTAPVNNNICWGSGVSSIKTLNENIYIIGGFAGNCDLNPTLSSDYSLNSINGNTTNADAYILKLGNCDATQPATSNTQTFCSLQNPTVSNLSPNSSNFNWYINATSSTELTSSTPLINGQVYYVSLQNGNCPESLRTPVIVTINQSPNAPISNNQTFCENANANLNNIVISGQNIKWYNSNTDLTDLPTNTILQNNTTYYASQTVNGCESTRTPILITINSDTLPTLTSPQTFCIQQNATLNTITITGQNIKWYDASLNGNLLPNTTALVNGTTYYASQTINGCESNRVPVVVQIQNTPTPTGNANQSFCTSQNATVFDIITNGTNVTWYNSATNTTPLANTTLVTNNTTYYATQTINGCESVNRLAVTISLINTLNATNYSEIICDNLNDNQEISNITSYNANLISSTGNVFSYYNNYNDALNQNGQITNFANYNLVLGTKIFYIRIDSPNTCFQVVTLTLELVSKPIIPINDTEPLCEGRNITLNGGNNYDSYSWSTGETSQIITITQPGNYSVIVTENHGTTTCNSTKNFVVVNSNIATIQEIISSDWTENNNTITVLLHNNSQGDYEYSLNGIDFQDSNVFNNLEAGEYTVFVKDKNGCGIVSEELYLLMYPKFFTPNGDGYNDFWKIKFSENEPNLTIKIFDRYGKFLKQLGTNSIGWDGKYLGKDVPSSDYWFVVTRENGKEYKGHFSLKR